MAASSSGSSSAHPPRGVAPGVVRTEPASTSSPHGSSSTSRLDGVSRTLFAPFQHRKRDSHKILADLAPVIMTPKMMAHAQTVSARPRAVGVSSTTRPKLDFATLGRTPLRLGLGARRTTSRELAVVETASELLAAPLPDAFLEEEELGIPSLLRGFEATVPSADGARARRRATRNVDAPRLGLKRLSVGARGLMTEPAVADEAESEEDGVVVSRERGRRGRKKRGRESLSANKVFGREELERQTREIARDKQNLHVRRSLLHNDITEITSKIAALDAIRARLEEDLFKLQEDELELDDELLMVQERLELETSINGQPGSRHASLMASSRRRKGPAFLPSEHDELPPGVAFMSLECGSTPITSLDFSEPYGTLVTASQDDSHPRVWDLLAGEEVGRLRGHVGTIKALQVEAHLCATGATDGAVRLWDLRRVDGDVEGSEWDLSDVLEEAEEDGEGVGTGGSVVVDHPHSGANGSVRTGRADDDDAAPGPCVRVLEGHSKGVTALYFENDTLVTGASDKTLRQWDLATGQCVMTMDILWAISHPSTLPAGHMPGFPAVGATAAVGAFAVPTPPYADGSWELYQDFIGAVQSWEYALVSGSGDGAVRMWDMRTGQAHRTLLGHTGPVTCLQFDEIHVVSGSLDKSVRIWDLRTGGIFETVKYEHAVTALQFDSRKIVSAAGENGVKIYNRTSMQHSTLSTNGHIRPVEKLRYMDRYLLSGGRDATVKIWAL